MTSDGLLHHRYALLQGSLRPSGTRVPPASADLGQAARPVIRRGMLAWAAGGGGPDFFIALAQHPEWGNGHTVFAEVFPEDMNVIDTLMRRPLRVSNWGSINATELITPMPFKILGPLGAQAIVQRRRDVASS
jgi:cyclophilin family peptidyl-prolyl cis-trans isomerase